MKPWDDEENLKLYLGRIDVSEFEDEDDLEEEDFEMVIKGKPVKSVPCQARKRNISDDFSMEQVSNPSTLLTKKCDTTSSPTSSTPIPGPPLLLSNSMRQELVYNNNGYSIKSSCNETSYSIGVSLPSKVDFICQKIAYNIRSFWIK